MIITFCGHADYRETDEDRQRVLSLLTEWVGDSPALFYLGGYGNFDGFAQRCGREYQKTHPNIKLILITPYITPNYQKNQLEYCKKNYDEILYPPLESVPLRFAVSHRNKWMIDEADCVIAYVTRHYGGAFQAYRHAKVKKKAVCNLTGKDL